jgi:hypothetical protein
MERETFKLKRLSAGAIDAALKRALHYRYLNQPYLAESICRDILDAEPDHTEAYVTLIMSLCDQFRKSEGIRVQETLSMAASLRDDYDRAYYSGLVCERRAEAALLRGGHASGAIAYEWFRRAMDHYADAEARSPVENDDAVLRWNTCARILNSHPDVRPREEDTAVHMLE